MDLDIAALLEEARPPERTVRVCLRGDLVAAHEQAVADLTAARQGQRGDDTDMASAGAARALAEQVQAIEEQMETARRTFRFRALPPSRWLDLTARHRIGEDDADLAGFFDELVPACCVSPRMAPDQWQALAERLSFAQVDDIRNGAWLVNRGSVDVGKSLTASAVLATPGSAES